MVVQESLEAYHQNPATGSSMLKVLLESPKRYKAEFIDRTIQRKETKALSFGSAIHLALLEPKVFLERYAVEPDVRRNTNIYKDWKEGVLARDPHAVILSQEEMDSLQGMIDAVMANERACAMLRNGIPERSVYQFMETGEGEQRYRHAVKARPDWLHEKTGDIIDVKTCRDVGYKPFQRQLYELGYHLSAAFYRDVVDLELGKRDRSVWWICLEKEPPYEVAVYRADDMIMDRGEGDYRKALWRLQECTASGIWHGKQIEPQDINLPGYAQYD